MNNQNNNNNQNMGNQNGQSGQNSYTNSNQVMNTSAKQALNTMKYEIANQIGVPLKQGYNGDLTSKQAGSVGGEMVKRMISYSEQNMANGGSTTQGK